MIVFCLFVLCTLLLSVDFSVDDTREEAKAVMKNIYESYVKIIPYIYTHEKVLHHSINKNEQQELLENLNDLSRYFKEARHVKLFKTPAMEAILDVINVHMINTISYMKSGNFIFAQKRLNEIGSLCISCHTQLPVFASRESFGYDLIKEKRIVFDSDYSYANYLYLMRDFDESKIYFEKSIANNLDSLEANKKIIPILRKIVSIDTKIHFNYNKANTFLEKWSCDPRLLSSDRDIIINWKSDLLSWKDFNAMKIKSIPDFITNKLAIINQKIEKLSSADMDITLLISSGILSKYLIDNPHSKQAPAILYWMAIAENQLSENFFFSTGEAYLKDCIRNYPKDPFAEKCYHEFSKVLTASFSGSGGISIPTEEKKVLLDLKKKLNR